MYVDKLLYILEGLDYKYYMAGLRNVQFAFYKHDSSVRNAGAKAAWNASVTNVAPGDMSDIPVYNYI